MAPHTSIIILNYNGSQDTIACVESLFEHPTNNSTIILIDNGSRPEEVEQLKAFCVHHPQLHVVYNLDNKGFAGGVNQGIAIARSQYDSAYVYLLNNDAIVTAGTITTARNHLETHAHIGIINSQSRLAAQPELLDQVGHLMLTCGDSIPRGRLQPHAHYNTPTPLLGTCGAGMLIRMAVIEDIGVLMDSFFLNYEDAEFSLRAMVAGWDCLYLPTSVIYHKVNTSIAKVRDYDFSVRSQYNQFLSYTLNMPLTVHLLNLPAVLLRDAGVIVLNFLFGRWTLLRIFLHARLRFLVHLPWILRLRSERAPLRRRSSWYILRLQRSFLPTYATYAWEILFRRRVTALDGY